MNCRKIGKTYWFFSFAAYELWFKQILWEVDSVRKEFIGVEKKCVAVETKRRMSILPEGEVKDKTSCPRAKVKHSLDSSTTPQIKSGLPDAPVDESKMLQIIGRMQRVAMILKVSPTKNYQKTEV